MTARPQDVALLPLPELPVPHGGMTGDYWTDDQIEEYATDYARANVTAALASAQAREDELRAEVDRWRGHYDDMSRRAVEAVDRREDAEARAERLAEALREARASADAARTGYSGQHASGTFRRMVQKIDAALSTNAATQTGE